VEDKTYTFIRTGWDLEAVVSRVDIIELKVYAIILTTRATYLLHQTPMCLRPEDNEAYIASNGVNVNLGSEN
jgi:hypothetical protein